MIEQRLSTTVGSDAYGRRVVERLQQSLRYCGAVQQLQNGEPGGHLNFGFLAG